MPLNAAIKVDAQPPRPEILPLNRSGMVQLDAKVVRHIEPQCDSICANLSPWGESVP